MSDKLENPPAFPHTNPAFDDNWNKDRQIDGMSLRDYFAAAALMGLRSGFNLDYNKCAQEAYKIADAMLEEKNKGVMV